MKNILLSVVVLLTAQMGFAKTLTHMQVIEKSAYALSSLVNRNAIDHSYLTDVMTLTVKPDAGGFTVEMRSPTDSAAFNSLVLTLDTQGKLKGFKDAFVARYSRGPVFAKADASVIIDLGAEAVVDHVSESADLVVVSEKATAVQISVQAQGPLFQISLNDGRVYKIQMDADANVLSKGF